MERRSFLRWAIGSAIALGATVTAANFIISLQRPALINVKVVYLQMAQYVDISDEIFALQNPASIRDLRSAIALRHPSLSPQMMAAMVILVNGAAATGLDFELKDGDEVDFIPMMAGG